MADNIISQHFTKNDGSQIGNDAQLINGVYQNEKIINKNSGEKFVKSSNYGNVFDKVDEKISKIDDANANGMCSCRNSSGIEVDTFKCHVPVSNSAPTLNWGQSSTIGTVDGKPLTVVLPPNPNTDTNTTYSAGAGLTLNGTTFYIDENWLKVFIKNNSGSGSGHGGYTKGERYGGTWYVSGSSDGLKSSSSIYSNVECHSGGCSGGPSCSLQGDHPPSGTYYCEMINTGISGSSISSCYIYTITYN